MKTRDPKQTNRRSILCWLLVTSWIAFVLYLSCQNGEQTIKLSMGIAEKPYVYLQEKRLINSADVSLKDFIQSMRFVAHIAVFTVLGILLVAPCNLSFRWFAVVSAIIIGVSTAIVSEVVKLWIVGRHCDWFEASVNVVSCLAGTAFAYCARRLFKHVFQNFSGTDNIEK